ncbi:MAG: hypothetical protein ACLQU2_01255, partial [Candidatus Binataceae bacterium]
LEARVSSQAIDHMRKVIGTALCTLLILVGVGMENIAGDWADDESNQIRYDQQQHIMDAEGRAANAQTEAVRLRIVDIKLARLFAGRQVASDAELWKLHRFIGTWVWIATTPYPDARLYTRASGFLGSEYTRDFTRAEEALEFVRSFSEMGTGEVGWTPIGLGQALDMFDITRGVEIWTSKAFPVGKDPYAFLANTPEEKASAAAEALAQYLRSDLLLESTRHSSGGPIQKGLFTKFNVPSDGIFVEIGLKDLDEELNNRRDRLNSEVTEAERFGEPLKEP